MKGLAMLLVSGLVLSACNDVVEPEPGLVAVKSPVVNTLVPDLTVTDFGTDNFPVTLNDVGQVVVLFFDGTILHSFIWQDGTMTDLGTFGGSGTSAQAINNLGQIAGTSFNELGQRRGFIWQNGVMTDLGIDDMRSVVAINEAGQIAGAAGSASGTPHAFIWQNGTATDLGALPGFTASAAFAVNDVGQIVGRNSGNPEFRNQSRATLWQNGSIVDLHPGHSSVATTVNNLGQVLVNCFTEGRAFIWQNGTLTDLGTMGGSFTSGRAMNNVGQVVGLTVDAEGARRDFIWQNGTFTDIGTLGWPNGGNGAASIVNDLGQVAGYSLNAIPQVRPFLWENGVMTDLLQSFAEAGVGEVVAANGAGQLVGFGSLGDGTHGFLWNTRRPATPAEEVAILTNTINAMVADGTLSNGQGRSLLSKLDAASHQIARGNHTAAANVLEAFVKHVQGQVTAGLYSAATGQTLIDAAQAAITQLSTPG